MKVDLKRVNDSCHFEAINEDGNIISIDSSPDSGGEKKGVRPMQMLLMALGSCSGIDIVLILKKQKQLIEDFQISVEGERQKGKEPSLWEWAHVHFKLKGKIELEKAQRAAQLSIEKYCSVAKTLEAGGTKITYQVSLNE